MDEQLTFWRSMAKGVELEDLVSSAMQGAARNLSAMVGRTLDIETHSVIMVPLDQINDLAGGAGKSMVGVYLLIEGDLRGQAMVLQTVTSALRLVDLLMGMPVGTSVSLDEMERAALGEVGNIMVAGFLNGLVAVTGGQLLPSPPTVMVDALGSITNVIASSASQVCDGLLIIDTAIRDAERAVQARLWVLPEPVQERAGGLHGD